MSESPYIQMILTTGSGFPNSEGMQATMSTAQLHQHELHNPVRRREKTMFLSRTDYDEHKVRQWEAYQSTFVRPPAQSV